jgi:hypothetical protein
MRHCGRHGAAKLESGLLTDCDRGRRNEDSVGLNAMVANQRSDESLDAETFGSIEGLLSGSQIERRPTPVSALDNRGDAHASRGAGGDEPPARVGITGEDLGQRADDAGTGGGERMADSDAAALHVEF